MAKILFLNSGGKEAEVTLEIIQLQNPDSYILSFNIETDDEEGMNKARDLSENNNIDHFILPFNETRKYIKGDKNPDEATRLWSFEMHFKGIQYAMANNFDYVVSGHKDEVVGNEFEDLLVEIMEVCKRGKKVGILRPLRRAKNINDVENILKNTRDKFKPPKGE